MCSYRQAATTLHELLGVDLSFGFLGVRKAVLQAGTRLDQEPTIAHRPDLPPRAGDPPPALTFAFDGGYARLTRKSQRRNFEILTGACEKNGKIRVFATAYMGCKSLQRRLSRFVGRVGHDTEEPTALMTDGAESLLRLRKLIPVPTRLVLDYFHVAMKIRHADQCIGRIPPYRFSPNGSVFEALRPLQLSTRVPLERPARQVQGILGSSAVSIGPGAIRATGVRSKRRVWHEQPPAAIFSMVFT